jgi:PAS domain S-box-containing protein
MISRLAGQSPVSPPAINIYYAPSVRIKVHIPQPAPNREERMSPSPPSPDSRTNAGALNESLLASIVASSDDAIISKTLDGLVTSWNRAAERIFGYTAAEMIGQPITRLFPPDRLWEASDLITRLQRGETVKPFETVRRRKDGAHIEVSVTISPIRDTTGRIVGASKIARDITERKRKETRIEELATSLDRIYRLVPGVIYQFMLRPDGTSCLPFASEAVRQLFEVAPEDVREDA